MNISIFVERSRRIFIIHYDISKSQSKAILSTYNRNCKNNKFDVNVLFGKYKEWSNLNAYFDHFSSVSHAEHCLLVYTNTKWLVDDQSTVLY